MELFVENIIIILLICFSSFFDITVRKIPNTLTLSFIILGFIYNLVVRDFSGFIFSFKGVVIGIALLIVPFIFGGMGGGDVKLMAAIGALKGWRFVISSAIFSGLAGGVIVIVILIKQKKLLITLKRVLAIILKPIMFVLTLTFENKKLKQFNDWLIDSQINWEKQYIPYGVAIGIGAIMALLI